MLHPDAGELLVEAALDLDHAARAGAGGDLRTRIPDVRDLLLQDRHGELGVLHPEDPRHPAALVGVLHLHKLVRKLVKPSIALQGQEVPVSLTLLLSEVRLDHDQRF